MFRTRSPRITPKTATSRRESVRRARFFWSSAATRLEDRLLLSTLPPSVLSGATLIATIDSNTPGNLASGAADLYKIDPTADGRLIALTTALATNLELQLSLYDSQGDLLVESDGQSAGKVNPIDFHVTAGTDYLEVQSLSGSGAYTLTTSLTPSSDPNQNPALSPAFQLTGFGPIAVGDFTGNGILDLVAPDGVHLGTGDGTFEAPSSTAALVDPTAGPSAIAVGNFNGDHNLDVAVALAYTDSISISFGNGNGTFQPATNIPLSVPGNPLAIVAGDFGNGRTDLAVAVAGTGGSNDDVVVLMSNGDGTFTQSSPIPVGLSPVGITSGTFGQNGHFLAVADNGSADLTILTNQGGGSFSPTETIELPAFSNPTSIVADDFGTGNQDLAVTDSTASVVDVLQGNGDGAFQPQPVASDPHRRPESDIDRGG